MSEGKFWRKCSTCKTSIGFSVPYWVCNVSTCNRPPNSFVFCSVDCWDAHVPIMRHKDSWAEERTSPSATEAASMPQETPKPVTRLATSPTGPASLDRPRSVVINRAKHSADVTPTRHAPTASSVPASTAHAPLAPPPPDEILVVASKVKAYINARSGLNTSAGVMEALSDKIRVLCDLAIRSAQQHERKTVLDRDVH